jgi:cellobiose phosphorylase
MAVLHEKYYSKYKIPSIKSITSTLKSIGYSQEFIDSMMVKYKKRNELIEKKWKILEKRFDAPSTASRNKKKKADKKAETEPEPETEVVDDEDLEEETKEDDEPEEDEAIVVDDEGDEEEVVEDDYVSDGGDE